MKENKEKLIEEQCIIIDTDMPALRRPTATSKASRRPVSRRPVLYQTLTGIS
ncbi:hypothetical protein DPMN_111589 [Dreissena polymorpha]|uniref:Uncharacterized protein n=1 Tax=Dreissena polymorpha TaxID=45954 RepID=A0A9D4KFG0_DREPO|nr:hypothetical protein DPMN_111589 [Dreissena polymorpha]